MTRLSTRLLLSVGLTALVVIGALLAGHVPASAGADSAPGNAGKQPPAGAAASPTEGRLEAEQGFSTEFVKTEMPARQIVADLIPVTGKLSLDKRQVRIASSRVAGRLGRIFVFEGQSVKQAEPLAEIYSPEFISAENEFLLARHFKDTLSSDSVDHELRGDAEATLQSATNKLKVLGAAEEDVAQIAKSGTAAEYLRLRAPIDGVVTQRNVDPGAYLNVGDTLMSLADLDHLWLFLNTYDADYASLKLGQQLKFRTPSLPGREFTGQIAFIAPSVDAATHTLPIRCDVPNAQLLLRPEMFVTGELKIGEREAWVVPKTAIIHIRDSDFVIVKDDDKHFRRVAVQGHPAGAAQYAIFGGLPEALPVVTDGSVLLNEMVHED